jgi:hypothetical protein
VSPFDAVSLLLLRLRKGVGLLCDLIMRRAFGRLAYDLEAEDAQVVVHVSGKGDSLSSFQTICDGQGFGEFSEHL